MRILIKLHMLGDFPLILALYYLFLSKRIRD